MMKQKRVYIQLLILLIFLTGCTSGEMDSKIYKSKDIKESSEEKKKQKLQMEDMTDEELKKHFLENEAVYKEYAELVEESEYMIDYGKKEILFGATAFHNFYLNMQTEEAKQLGITSIEQVDQHGIMARFEEGKNTINEVTAVVQDYNDVPPLLNDVHYILLDALARYTQAMELVDETEGAFDLDEVSDIISQADDLVQEAITLIEEVNKEAERVLFGETAHSDSGGIKVLEENNSVETGQVENSEATYESENEFYHELNEVDQVEIITEPAESMEEPEYTISNEEKLLDAIAQHNIEMVEDLIAAGVNVNADIRETRPLLAAIGNGKLDIAELLITNGADVNVSNSMVSYYPVHAVVGSSTEDNGKSEMMVIEALRLLLDNGADPNVITPVYGEEDTPLTLAVKGEYVEVVTFILENGADPNMLVNNNETALSIAKKSGLDEVVKLLESYGATE
jgi:hypothetical protein